MGRRERSDVASPRARHRAPCTADAVLAYVESSDAEQLLLFSGMLLIMDEALAVRGRLGDTLSLVSQD